MKKRLQIQYTVLSLLCVIFRFFTFAQVVPITNYSVNANGQVQLEVSSSSDKYYILKVRHDNSSPFEIIASMTLGQNGSTILTEPLEHYPIDHYQVLAYAINAPHDTDGDGIDDITEYTHAPTQNPLNFSSSIPLENGIVQVDQYSTFNTLSIQEDDVTWIPYLDGKEYAKFIIFDFPNSNPRIYFINTKTHDNHESFSIFMGENHLATTTLKGQIIFHPTVISSNGTIGTFSFNYTNNEGKDFTTVQRTHELLAANMPFLTNNLSYFITENNETLYNNEILQYQNSRVPVLFETNIFAGLNYWGLHQTEGYGFFRQVGLNEVPGPKDIVLYDYLPNALPRVGGIMTSVIQTPLSHVNLRAIQDNVPNAFIRDPLLNDTIANLLNHYVYYKVEQSKYTIREATLEEVNDWYEKSRPTTTQNPPLNLDYTKIKPLDHITFDMYDGFGAKCVNVATMRRFGFEEGTIPDGFGVPFFYYQEFMKYNHFFEEVDAMMKNPEFIADRDVRDSLLHLFREKIEKAAVPPWMWDNLGKMQRSFPNGKFIRCRSSTNNEDLPGFSGAGLYDSKTHKLNEGHISKSIKQVYASLWNLRAFEERDFYRINHFQASMGVLCHLNYEDEKVNGVGVSGDPVYNTTTNYYINSQKESELITNPGGSTPEEILLKKGGWGKGDYLVVHYSSLVGGDTLLMTLSQMDLLRVYLREIHRNFAILYEAEDNSTFAMDIEYKITSDNRLIVKQARPWVSYVPTLKPAEEKDFCYVQLFPNPAADYLNLTYSNCPLEFVRIVDMMGNVALEKEIDASGSKNVPMNIENLSPGIYLLTGFNENSISFSRRFVIH